MSKEAKEETKDYVKNGTYINGPKTTQFPSLDRHEMSPQTEEGRLNLQEAVKLKHLPVRITWHYAFKNNIGTPVISIQDPEGPVKKRGDTVELEDLPGVWLITDVTINQDSFNKKFETIFTIEEVK